MVGVKGGGTGRQSKQVFACLGSSAGLVGVGVLVNVHVVSQLLEVGLLLLNPLAQLLELLLLALPDGVVLLGALAALEGVAGEREC